MVIKDVEDPGLPKTGTTDGDAFAFGVPGRCFS
jgi:hypothetical protein